MAKGQLRSNREEKKPKKKERPKVAPGAPGSIYRTLEQAQSRHSPGKKKRRA
jgi:hypothetical protein